LAEALEGVACTLTARVFDHDVIEHLTVFDVTEGARATGLHNGGTEQPLIITVVEHHV
jgi:hypothetical protein